jgi:hypothetical protein
MWLLLKPEASAGEIEWVLRARGWPYEVRKIGEREVIVLPVNGQAVQEVASWEGVERVIGEGEGQPALVYAAERGVVYGVVAPGGRASLDSGAL